MAYAAGQVGRTNNSPFLTPANVAHTFPGPLHSVMVAMLSSSPVWAEFEPFVIACANRPTATCRLRIQPDNPLRPAATKPNDIDKPPLDKSY